MKKQTDKWTLLKNQGRRSNGSAMRGDADGQTDQAHYLPASLSYAVDNEELPKAGFDPEGP